MMEAYLVTIGLLNLQRRINFYRKVLKTFMMGGITDHPRDSMRSETERLFVEPWEELIYFPYGGLWLAFLIERLDGDAERLLMMASERIQRDMLLEVIELLSEKSFPVEAIINLYMVNSMAQGGKIDQ